MGSESIAEQIEISELGAAISRFLNEEKPLARRIFIRRYFFEDGIEVIAKDHGLTVANVKVTLHRARTRLAAFLSKEGFFI